MEDDSQHSLSTAALEASEWTETLYRRLMAWRTRAQNWRDMHREAAAFYERWHYILSLCTVGGASLTSGSIFTSDGASSPSSFSFVRAMSAIVIALTALQSYFGLEARAKAHKAAFDGYGRIVNMLSRELTLSVRERRPVREVIDNVVNEFNRLQEMSHMIPSWIRDRSTVGSSSTADATSATRRTSRDTVAVTVSSSGGPVGPSSTTTAPPVAGPPVADPSVHDLSPRDASVHPLSPNTSLVLDQSPTLGGGLAHDKTNGAAAAPKSARRRRRRRQSSLWKTASKTASKTVSKTASKTARRHQPDDSAAGSAVENPDSSLHLSSSLTSPLETSLSDKDDVDDDDEDDDEDEGGGTHKSHRTTVLSRGDETRGGGGGGGAVGSAGSATTDSAVSSGSSALALTHVTIATSLRSSHPSLSHSRGAASPESSVASMAEEAALAAATAKHPRATRDFPLVASALSRFSSSAHSITRPSDSASRDEEEEEEDKEPVK